MGVKVGFWNYFGNKYTLIKNTIALFLNSMLPTVIKHLLCVRPCVALGMKGDEMSSL